MGTGTLVKNPRHSAWAPVKQPQLRDDTLGKRESVRDARAALLLLLVSPLGRSRKGRIEDEKATT